MQVPWSLLTLRAVTAKPREKKRGKTELTVRKRKAKVSTLVYWKSGAELLHRKRVTSVRRVVYWIKGAR